MPTVSHCAKHVIARAMEGHAGSVNFPTNGRRGAGGKEGINSITRRVAVGSIESIVFP